MKQKPIDQLVLNGLCICAGNKPCEHCLFWEKQNTPSGRKALCERIIHFLAPKQFYQQVIKQTVNKVFPGQVIYDDQKDVCTMLFESALFEDVSQGKTPFEYFLAAAPLSPQEKTLYQAWQERTIFGFFVVDDIILEKEIHLTDLSGKKRYRVYGYF